MTVLACVDGGLICGPILVGLITLVLSWLGLRKGRCKKCEAPHEFRDEHWEPAPSRQAWGRLFRRR